MGIIISRDGNKTERVDQSHFGLENKLQEYVKDNPDIVPIYEIQEGAKLLILAREFSTNSGPIDALGVDQDGNLYVVETKLYKNPDKRIVLAQALDYGASLWRHSGDALNFISSLEHKAHTHFDMSLQEKIQDFFEIEDSQPAIDSMVKNVQTGNIKFVILMDKVEDRLKDLVAYVNQNSRFDIYAVDLEYYKYNEFEIIIPKLYGSEVKKTVTTNDESLMFDNQKIVRWIEEAGTNNVKIDTSNSVRSFLRFTTSFMDELMPPRDDVASGWKNGNAYYYEIVTQRSGLVKVQLAFNSNGVNLAQSEGQRKVMDYINKSPKGERWTWFVAQSWKIDYRSGEETLKNEVLRVLAVDIPNFEQNIKMFLSGKN